MGITKHLFLLLFLFAALPTLPAQVYPSRPAPPPPPSEPSWAEETYRLVEEMPRFPGCEDLSGEEREACAKERLAAYVYKNLRYPEEARRQGITGVVEMSFVVDKDGRVITPAIIRDIGGGCGAEAIRALLTLNENPFRFVPGRAGSRPVRVQMQLEVEFAEEMMKGRE